MDVTTFTSALIGVMKIINDKSDNNNGIFFRFFIINSLIDCYNITVCNNITFISQGKK
tara:strand:- start:391 stop:564 length:174 start_codon:yes stop_codon:yes gene_type:complete